jgi:hypothetical protein
MTRHFETLTEEIIKFIILVNKIVIEKKKEK